MTEEQLNNTEDPLCGFAPPQTLEQAIQAINRLLWSDGVEDDDHADAEVVKSFLVNDNMQEIAQKKLYKDRVSKTIPVMETTIEGAQKRISKSIEWIEYMMEWFDVASFVAVIEEGYSTSALSSLRTTATNLEYIGVFLDTVGDEMAAMSTSYNSLHERYVQALRDVAELRRENGEIRRGNLNNLHAANDNG